MFIHVFPFQMECDSEMIMEIWIFYTDTCGGSYRFLILEDEILKTDLKPSLELIILYFGLSITNECNIHGTKRSLRFNF